MKVHGIEIKPSHIELAQRKLLEVDAFDHGALRSQLEAVGVPSYIKDRGYHFIAYGAASRILVLWKKEKLIKPMSDNHGGYWEWTKKGLASLITKSNKG